MNTSRKTDLSISMGQANIYSLLFAVPIAITLAWIYIYRWGLGQFAAGFNDLFADILVVLILGTVTHELIHGLTWMLFGRLPLNSIKFGFQLKSFTPYAHCKVPLKVNPYRIGTAMPGIVLGVIPAIIGIVNGSGWLLTFGLFFTVAAGGDMLILWLLRNVSSDKLVEDHPTNAGCYIIEDHKTT